MLHSWGTKLASCLKNLGDDLKKAQLLGIVYLSNVAEKFCDFLGASQSDSLICDWPTGS
jgi:hypothetical protein